MRSAQAPRRADAALRRPVYARVLGLRHLELGGLACFVLFEGALTLGTLLALAELASWWTVVVLPAVVAAMVKFNDAVAGLLRRAAPAPVRAVAAVRPVAVRPAVGRARVVPRVRRAAAGVVRATATVDLPARAIELPLEGGHPYPGSAAEAGTARPLASGGAAAAAASGGAPDQAGGQPRQRSGEEFRGRAARHSANRRYR